MEKVISVEKIVYNRVLRSQVFHLPHLWLNVASSLCTRCFIHVWFGFLFGFVSLRVLWVWVFDSLPFCMVFSSLGFHLLPFLVFHHRRDSTSWFACLISFQPFVHISSWVNTLTTTDSVLQKCWCQGWGNSQLKCCATRLKTILGTLVLAKQCSWLFFCTVELLLHAWLWLKGDVCIIDAKATKICVNTAHNI